MTAIASAQIDPKKYSRLLARTLPRTIATEEENKRMLAIVNKLMKKGEGNLTPEEDVLLDLLFTLIEKFEEGFYKIEKKSASTPASTLKFLMEARGLSPKDLWPKQASFTAPGLKPHSQRLGARTSSTPGLWRSNLPQEIFPCLASWRPVVAGCTDRSRGTSSRGEKMESFLKALCAPDVKRLTCHWRLSRNSATRLPDGSGGQWVKRALRLALLFVLSLAGMAQAQDRHYKPSPKLTPGDALNVTADDLCKPGHAGIEGNISVGAKSQVFDRYGIRGTLIGYNVDHLIPQGLGGSNSIKNLWPQPLAGEWTYHMKNRLEHRLRKLVCSGALDVKIAQQEIARDWIGAYKEYLSARGQVRSNRRRSRVSRSQLKELR